MLSCLSLTNTMLVWRYSDKENNSEFEKTSYFTQPSPTLGKKIVMKIFKKRMIKKKRKKKPRPTGCARSLLTPLDTPVRCKNVGSSPKQRVPPPFPIDIHGVKRDLGKKHWCIPHHLTQSFIGARTLNLGDSVIRYT